MKIVMGWVFLILFCSSFLIAASSEADAVFIMNTPQRGVQNYVPPESSFADFLGYFALVAVALIFAYFIFKKKESSSKKKVSRKKVSRKKVSRKKIKKKKSKK